MRYTFLLSLILLVACNNSAPVTTTAEVDTLRPLPDTLQVKESEPENLLPKTYANNRFRDVTVERIGQDSFLVRGQGQIVFMVS